MRPPLPSAVLIPALACAPGLPGLAHAAEDGGTELLDVHARTTPGLVGGLACEAARCLVQVDGRVLHLDPGTLALGAEVDAPAGRLVDAGGPAILGACPEPAEPPQEPADPEPADPEGRCLLPLDGGAPVPLSDETVPLPREPAPLAALWNARHAAGWRVPFLDRAPSPTGGMLFLLREGGGRLMRTGGGVRVAELDVPAPLYRYEPAVALHPTGAEAFVLAWPGGTLTGVATGAMRPRWTLDLGPAAHGLFLDVGGRLLVAEEGGATEVGADVPEGRSRPVVPEGVDPTGDLALLLARDHRPDAARTVVVDLAGPRLVWREDGRYLSLMTRPDGSTLLATERALVRLAPGPAPSAADTPAP